MNINFGTSFGGPSGVRPGMEGQGVDAAKAKPADAARPAPGLVVSQGPAGLSSAEPTADVPAAALRRDDDLGRLAAAAFNLPPPPMPAFGD